MALHSTRFHSFFPALFGVAVIFSGAFALIGMEDDSSETPRAVGSWAEEDFDAVFPTLTSGFNDWEHCDLGGRIQTNPPLFSLPSWGPAALTSGSGCSTCGGGMAFNGDPRAAALGFALSPPNDMDSNAGQLPPSPHDHPYVMADTGEVVYSEVDFVIKGQGFDFVWQRTYRSALEFEGWYGYGWTHGAELYLVKKNSTSRVGSWLGDGRAEDVYTYSSGTYTSPDGFNDNLTTGTRGSSYTPSKYANKEYYIKTEKNGVVWEFDLAVGDGTGVKNVYVCTSITDPWNNDFSLEYDATDTLKLTKVTDVEGHEATFSYNGAGDLITQVTVSSSDVGDYGNVTIDYSYTDNLLTQVDKHDTRETTAGSKVTPYTKYAYYDTANAKDDNLHTIKYSSTSASYTFDYLTAGADRCTDVTDEDTGQDHVYAYDQNSGTDYLTQYTDPSGQRRDFVYTDYGAGDRTIAEVWEYLEDEDGSDLSGHYDLEITRDCDCGRITKLVYPDGSKEEWAYDTDGNTTKYTRSPKTGSSETALVKQWTYTTFNASTPTYTRMLTSSGGLQATANPSAAITWVWETDGCLDKVQWPTVSSQAIEYDYDIGTDGVLDSIYDPEDNQTAFVYSYVSGDLKLTTTKGEGTTDEMVTSETFDELGNVISSTGHLAGSTSTYTVTPGGRVLTVAGPNSQKTRHEFDPGGRLEEVHTDISSSVTVKTEIDYHASYSGLKTSSTEDPGGLGLASAYSLEAGAANRYIQSLNPDGDGTRKQRGYGSYGLAWKEFNVDGPGGSPTLTETVLYERDTMGRVTALVASGDTISYVYDGFGRLAETIVDLPNSKERKTIYTRNSWGEILTTQVKVDSAIYSSATNTYDAAFRLNQTTLDDPENVLDDRVTSYTLDKNGRTTTRNDRRGKNWTSEWFADGRLKKTTDPIGNEVSYTYDDTNRKVTRTSKEKNTSTAGTTNFKTVTTYNAAGWPASVKDEGSASGNRTTSFEYDYIGNRTKSTYPDSAETTYVYDAAGRMTSETTDIDGLATAVTAYEYSDGGLKTKVTDASSKETTWTYDSFGRELTVVLPVSGVTTATYTTTYGSNGRPATVTDPMGVVKTFNYDDGGRMNQLDINKAGSGLGGPDRLAFVFDNMDNVTSGKTQTVAGETVTDVTSVTRSYDGYGQLKNETQYGGHVMAFTYDAGGALNKITYPTSSPITSVEYVMDDNGRVDSVKRTLDGGAVQTVASFEYDGDREIERSYAQHDLKRTQSWTSFREPDELKYLKSSTSALLTGFDNAWDSSGQITVRERLHDDDGTYEWGEVYRYDEMGRLVKMWTNQRNPQSYSSSNPTANYDDKVEWDLGKVYERDGVTTTPYGQASESPLYTNNDGYQYTAVGTTMTWDDNGQLTDWGTTAYAWTTLGQMSQVDVSGETARDYTYDAFGRRVETKVDSVETEMLYRDWHSIGSYDSDSATWLWQEVPMSYGEGIIEHVALDTNDMDEDENTAEYLGYPVHQDWQDTVWALSNASGAMIERYVQDDPFGASHTLDASDANIGDYASEVYQYKRMHSGLVEPVSGLYDFRNRWYSPVSGGWLSRDPLGYIDTNNLYVFAVDNPLSYSDTLGLCAAPRKGLGGWKRTFTGGIGSGILAQVEADVMNQLSARDWDCGRECFLGPQKIGMCGAPVITVKAYFSHDLSPILTSGAGFGSAHGTYDYTVTCPCEYVPITDPVCAQCHNAGEGERINFGPLNQ